MVSDATVALKLILQENNSEMSGKKESSDFLRLLMKVHDLSAKIQSNIRYTSDEGDRVVKIVGFGDLRTKCLIQLCSLFSLITLDFYTYLPSYAFIGWSTEFYV